MVRHRTYHIIYGNKTVLTPPLPKTFSAPKRKSRLSNLKSPKNDHWLLFLLKRIIGYFSDLETTIQ